MNRFRGISPFVVLGLCLLGLFGYYKFQPKRWNVLVITIDTTRADHLGCYGRSPTASPTIDSLASGGVLFENAYATVPLTTPSHSSIMTGKYPFSHGVRDNGLFVLPPSQETLAEVLKQHGYSTGAAIGAFPLVRKFGLDQGFDFYDDQLTKKSNVLGTQAQPINLFFDERNAGDVNGAIYEWLEAQKGPFFAWVHYYDPHQPWQPKTPFREQFSDPYLGEIASCDHQVSRLLDALQTNGTLENTLIVIASDHGEGLEEHNEATHGHLLYNATLHIPLIVRVPGLEEGKRIQEWVSTVDIMPTVLDYMNIEVPNNIHGQSLKPLIEGHSPFKRALPLYAETLSPRLSYGWGELRAIMQAPYKYIHGPRPELFDLETDPNESHKDLEEHLAGESIRFRSILENLIESHAAPPEDALLTLEQDEIDMLRSLGYVSSGNDVSLVDQLREDGIPPQDRAQDITRWSQARHALSLEKPLTAKVHLRDLIERDPLNPVYIELMVHCESMLGNPIAAEQLLDQLGHSKRFVRLDSRTPLAVAHAYLETGSLDDATRMYELSLSIQPDAERWVDCARIYHHLNNKVGYVTALKQSLICNPNHVPSLVALAVEDAKSGNYQQAEFRLTKAIDRHPQYAPAWLNLGVMAHQHRQYRNAVDCFSRALEFAPVYEQAHLYLIESLVNNSQLNEAGDALNTFGRLCPASDLLDDAAKIVKGAP